MATFVALVLSSTRFSTFAGQQRATELNLTAEFNLSTLDSTFMFTFLINRIYEVEALYLGRMYVWLSTLSV